ncbi:5-carboxymethyl-2-hydroxymuconate isomerase [Sphingomonas sp. Root710]|uniref:fumarylacetoacetate hydrolase family protein n=1 Tax=Sphingomonas sp. Root710 TaxID=1736594 RepID=UPI00070036D3|nr:fumarylacetoacetate hydrolase family protein [Sphingomonas sp. Root710]KRB85534.1 5-carboxymethyl-2-hydroxymuconate isomerase [Sphingomonas sp. Root710]
MRLARFTLGGDPMIGRVVDDGIVSLSTRIVNFPKDMVDLIEHWAEFSGAIEALGRGADHKLADVKLLAPVARPGKILCMGLNYADHVLEAKLEKPEHQTWFSKAVTTVNGPYDRIERPLVSTALDYEAELVFVVGKRCRHVSPEDAKKVIFGYCVGNDVSVRDWQRRTGQWMMGKTFDTHAPFGPYIVTPDEIDVGNLGIRCFVNGEKRQDSNTSNLIFDCSALVAHLSQAMTLEPGDVIYTGTSGGVGGLMKPPKFLQPGDRVRVEIDGIGFIENEVVDEVAAKGTL